MSLDIYLEGPEEEGQCVCRPCDNKHTYKRRPEYFSANITHNLAPMARAAGFYEVLWSPEELELNRASQLIPLLEEGLAKLTAEPEKFKAMNPSNGWGTYDGLAEVVT